MSQPLKAANVLRAVRTLLRDHRPLLEAVAPARARKRALRAEVDALILPIWEKWRDANKPQTDPLGFDWPESIRVEYNLYMASNDVAKPWFKVRNEAIMKAYPGTADGKCPALVAGHEAEAAEDALLKVATDLVGVTWRDLPGKLRGELLNTVLEALKHEAFL